MKSSDPYERGTIGGGLRPAKISILIRLRILQAIFAFLAAGTFRTIEEAQQRVCPSHVTFTPDAVQQKVYDELFPLYRDVYFGFGKPAQGDFGNVLPKLIQIARADQGVLTAS